MKTVFVAPCFSHRPASAPGLGSVDIQVRPHDALTTLSFTVSCVRQGAGGITYKLTAVARHDPSLERVQRFSPNPCGSGGPMTLTNLPLRATATTWKVTATAKGRNLSQGVTWQRSSNAVELATLADTPDTDADPLTAAFEDVPQKHSGHGEYSFLVRFSTTLDGGRTPVPWSFGIRNGKIDRVEKQAAGLWKVYFYPHSWRKVTVSLRRLGCHAESAVCAAGQRPLTNSPEAAIGGAAQLRVSGAWTWEAAGNTIRFKVTLNRAESHEVRVHYTTIDDVGTVGGNTPATAGSDYTEKAGTLVFAPGEKVKFVDVEVLPGGGTEGSEYFRLALWGQEGAYLAPKHHRAMGLIREQGGQGGQEGDTGRVRRPRSQAPQAHHADLIAQMYTWRNDPQQSSQAHIARWDRVLLAFGEPVSDTSLTPMTDSEAQTSADQGWSRWVKVAKALKAVITGTSGSDTLTGTGAGELLVGLGGADTLSGLGGSDELRGGSGNDRLTSGGGFDRFVFFSGETGANTITDFASGDVIVLKGSSLSSAADIIAGVQAVGSAGYRYTLASGLTVETTNNRSLRTEDFVTE